MAAPASLVVPGATTPLLHSADTSRVSSLSASHTNEADDELSTSSDPTMGPDTRRPGHTRQPRYPGDDTRLTSSREIAGWYFYGWAAEVFIVCGIGSFLPITLEQLARERGVLLSDLKTPCSTGLDVPQPPLLSVAGMKKPHHASQCVVEIFGAHINTASFALYTFSISVLVQSLLIISMSGAADHGRYRKTLLLSFAFIGAVSTMLFLPIVPKVYLLAALLAVIANTCVGASFVLLNSFLPLLVRHHPSVQFHDPSEERTSSSTYDAGEAVIVHPEESEAPPRENVESTDAFLPTDRPDSTQPAPPSPAAASPELQLSTRISSNGIGIGYLAAVLMQSASTFIVVLTGGSTFSLRLVLFLIGAWWFIFTIPAAFYLRPRPGPPLSTPTSRAGTYLAYLVFSWRSLGRTIVRARRLRDIVLFLVAWFLLSDGIATVSGTAVLFAKTTLGMKPAALALINVVVMLSGVVGAFTWSFASRLMGLRPSQTILACLLVFELIPIYALLGYVPAIQRAGVFGLQQPWEMYPLGAVYGLVMGGLSSYCRALYGELIPPGFEAAFYALYAITDKGSSVFGPAIVGAITDAYGEIRPAFWFLALLIGLPFPLMYFVDVERGRREGEAMARELEVIKTGIAEGEEGPLVADPADDDRGHYTRVGVAGD